MTAEEYNRMMCDLVTIRPSYDSAILLGMKDGEVTVSTYGEPRPLTALKGWAYKWLGGREDVKR
jgi:hypothetical protein